jgi:hypothetical protein
MLIFYAINNGWLSWEQLSWEQLSWEQLSWEQLTMGGLVGNCWETLVNHYK